MPIGAFGEDNQDKVVRQDEILAAYPGLSPVGTASGGVARVYAAPGMKGSIGFISPVSHKFCSTCKRVRLTADGRVRPCLGDNGEVDIRPYLGDEAALLAAIRDAVYRKPQGHHFESGFSSSRDMQHIGG